MSAPQTQNIPVGFKLPPNTMSNATNLVTPTPPGYIIDQSADPWGTCCATPWTNFPPPDKLDLFYQLICQRYGKPIPGDPLPEYGQTHVHSSDFDYALGNIAQQDPGWFKQQGFGPGPAVPAPGETIAATQTEFHDAEYAFNICQEVLQKSDSLPSPSNG